MASYAAYHRDPRNKATHFVGVPLIMLAILVPLSFTRMEVGGVGVTAAMLLAAAVLAYYFVLDLALAVAMLAVIAVLLFEGRRPALVDNVLQIFVAPIFLMAEVFFALGYKPELRKRLGESLSSSDHRAPSAPSS